MVEGIGGKGREGVRDLLDGMYALEEHVPYGLAVRACETLTEPSRLKELLRLLLVEERDLVVSRREKDQRKAFRYQFVVGNLVSYGPYGGMRVSLVQNEEMLGTLLNYFAKSDRIPGPVAREAMKICFALFDEAPEQMIEVLKKRPGLVSSFAHHIEHSPVSDFLIRVVSENERNSIGNPIFDPVFGSALAWLAQGKVYHCLSESFSEAASRESSGQSDMQSEERMENSCHSLVGILAKISKAIPFAAKNRNIWYLNLFDDPVPLKDILNAAMDAYIRNEESSALYIALRMLISIWAALFFERQGYGAKKGTGSQIDSSAMENAIRGFFPKLLEILTSSTSGKLGTTRVKIVEFLVACLKAGNERTVNALFKTDFQPAIFDLMCRHPSSSILHNFVSLSMDISFVGRSKICRIPWLKDFGLVRRLIELWRVSRESNSPSSATLQCTLRQIFLSLHEFQHKLEELGMIESIVEMIPRADLEAFDQLWSSDIVQFKLEQEKNLGGARPRRQAMPASASFEASLSELSSSISPPDLETTHSVVIDATSSDLEPHGRIPHSPEATSSWYGTPQTTRAGQGRRQIDQAVFEQPNPS
uniref:Serine/threonine-protein phosphatase 4 regulatory subunit 3-like central domain-containing protein n=1 Tax=Compsopogon caeruleus TaxID=31354 RepID=A0A7S1TD25_9RHOD